MEAGAAESTYTNVSSGETTEPYNADRLEEGKEPFVAGEIQISQIPHQHNILP
jgi:hypothetical protein